MSAAQMIIGTRLGPYEIQDLLGSGGMASVYRAFDPNLQRLVAVKVLSPEADAMPGLSDRFRQEARLIARLRHPNIVQVYDMGQHGDYTYMVQELLPGPTLEDWLSGMTKRGERVAREDVITIITQLGSALDAAHAAGIIHRDIKPANALWNATGDLVLTDFGIAKQIFTNMKQTQTGTVFGTPSYLSPEQAQSLSLTPASDIYSLGVVLYELIAGDVPFRGATPMQVVMSHIEQPPPPLNPPRPDVPAAVDAVIQRALAKDPSARFASASALAAALANAWTAVHAPAVAAPADIHNRATRVLKGLPPAPPWLTRIPTAVRLTGSTRPRALLLILSTLLVILLLVGVVLAVRGGPSPAKQSGTAMPSVGQATSPISVATSAPGSDGMATAAPVDAFAQLRALLEAGKADGRAGMDSSALLETLNSAQQAIISGNGPAAAQDLQSMQQTLLADARTHISAPDFVRQMLVEIDMVARSCHLTLPLSVSS